MARNPLYDIVFNCWDYDRYGNPGRGVIFIQPTITGTWTSISNIDSSIDLGGVEIDGTLIISYPQSGTAITFGLTIRGNYVSRPPISARIQWSRIGEFNFEIDRKNTAGEMPLEWRGTVWQILKLGSKILVYGSGGVTRLTPADNVFGQETLVSIGIKSERAVVDVEDAHLFVDKKGCLCQTTGNGIEEIGYEEFLYPMTSPVLTFDTLNKLVYICNGTYGYIYSIEDKSLCVGPVNITGLGYSNGELFVIADGAITMPTFQITTDIIDLFNRRNKTINEIEVGTNLTGTLEASVDYSLGINSTFVSTGWHRVTPEGIAFINCFGKEFKVHLRCTTAASFEIDYLKIRGVIHEYSPLDS
jgi:hypothetical protein